ncbi:MAG: DUF4097 family beta strand repeat-containing protein [Verrucomicrobiota bacterium]
MKLTLLLLMVSWTALAATEENTHKTLPATPGGMLIVDVDFGSIDVRTNTADDCVVVEVWRKITRKNQAAEEQFLRENPVQFLQKGDTLTVRCRTKALDRWFGSGRNRNEAKYVIQVPARFNARLHTDGGGIEVSGVSGDVKAETSGGGLRFTRLHGPVDGNTSGGGIRVADCESALKIHTQGGGIEVVGGGGSLDGDTSGGGVTVRNFEGPAEVESSGGGMTIENVHGKVNASTSGGAIHAVLLSPVPGDVSLTTSGGGVTVKVGAQAAFNLDAKTSGGGVSSDLPVTVLGKVEHGALKGTVNGGGPAIVLRSSGGGIHIKSL